jgi:cytoskeleton protein RodZ
VATKVPDEQPEAPVIPSYGVGPTLRAARDRMGKTLDECAEQLRIRQPFLSALEDSRHRDLPGGTYAIGFLRTYAEFLGLDGEELVRRFRQEGAGEFATRAQLVFPSPVSEGRIPGGAVIFLGVMLAAVAYGGWYWLSTREQRVAEIVPPLPDRLSSLLTRPAALTGDAKPAQPAEVKPADVRPAEPARPGDESAKVREDVVPPAEVEEDKPAEIKAPEVKPASAAKPADMAPPPAVPAIPAQATPAVPKPDEAKPVEAPAVAVGPAEPQPASPPDGKTYGNETAESRVVVKAANDDCWVQVREIDGSLLVSRLLRRGDAYRVPNRPGLTLMVGNAGALEVMVDGKRSPSLGTAGQVRRDIHLDPDKLMTGG